MLCNTPDVSFTFNLNLVFIAKRIGHLGAVCLPLLFFLSMKNSPIGLLIGSSHERLNIAHRWFGRTIIATIAAHTVTYIVYYARTGELDSLAETTNIFGEVGFALLILLGLTSIAIARRKMYEAFYVLHVLLTAGVLVLTWLHDDHTIPYVKASIGVIAIDRVMRVSRVWMNSKHFKFVSTGRLEIIDENLMSLIVPRPEFGPLKSWAPGSHAFINIGSIGAHQFHPFTIMSIPEEGALRFIIRKQTGFTSDLHKHEMQRSVKCAIDGPYGSLKTTRFNKYPNVLLIGGGVGITFILPILKSLLYRAHSKQAITFIWTARGQLPFEYFAKELRQVVQRQQENVDSQSTLRVVLHLAGASTDSGSMEMDEKCQSVVKDEEQADLASKVSETFSSKDKAELRRLQGRMHLGPVISDCTTNAESLAIGICGPNSMILEARQLVAKEITKSKKDIFCYTEEFEW